MRMYEILTGEVVRVYAENEEDAMEKLSNGEYHFVEAQSDILFVGAEIEQ